MEQLLLFLTPIIEAYAGNYGLAVQIISVVGSLRLFIKPIMSIIEAYVLITPNKEDDLLPAKIKENKIYKMLVYSLDWLASLKLPKK